MVVVLLAHTDHVCEISLGMHMVAISPLEVIFAAMQVLSPASTHKFLPEHEVVPIASDNSFLDGSSCYQSYFCLPPVYISPKAMVTCLTTLTTSYHFVTCQDFSFPMHVTRRMSIYVFMTLRTGCHRDASGKDPSA